MRTAIGAREQSGCGARVQRVRRRSESKGEYLDVRDLRASKGGLREGRTAVSALPDSGAICADIIGVRRALEHHRTHRTCDAAGPARNLTEGRRTARACKQLAAGSSRRLDPMAGGEVHRMGGAGDVSAAGLINRYFGARIIESAAQV